jgi:hypothetical protein
VALARATGEPADSVGGINTPVAVPPTPIPTPGRSNPTAEERRGTAAAAPQPTPLPATGPACPFEDFVCATAVSVPGAPSDAVQYLASTTKPGTESCSDHPALQSACADKVPGAPVRGIALEQISVVFVPEDRIASALAASLGRRAGPLSPRSVGCPITSAAPQGDCSNFFAVVLGYPAPASPDAFVLLIFERIPAGAAGLVGVALRAGGGSEVRGGPGSAVFATLGRRDAFSDFWFIPWRPDGPPK